LSEIERILACHIVRDVRAAMCGETGYAIGPRIPDGEPGSFDGSLFG